MRRERERERRGPTGEVLLQSGGRESVEAPGFGAGSRNSSGSMAGGGDSGGSRSKVLLQRG